MSAISDRIFSLLQERGIEQKDFARRIGVSDKAVSAWKTGRSHSYTKYLAEIAETLRVPVEYLLERGKPMWPTAAKQYIKPVMPDDDVIEQINEICFIAHQVQMCAKDCRTGEDRVSLGKLFRIKTYLETAYDLFCASEVTITGESDSDNRSSQETGFG